MKKLVVALAFVLLTGTCFADSLTLNQTSGRAADTSYKLDVQSLGGSEYDVTYTITAGSGFSFSPNIWLKSVAFKITSGGFNNLNTVSPNGTYLASFPTGFSAGSDGIEQLQINASANGDCAGPAAGWLCVDTASPGLLMTSSANPLVFKFKVNLAGAVMTDDWSVKAFYNYLQGTQNKTTIISLDGKPGTTNVPEPGTMALLGTGLLGLGLSRFRKN